MITPHSCSDDTLSNLIFVRIIRRCGVHVFFYELDSDLYYGLDHFHPALIAAV